MTERALANIHETTNLALEHMDDIFRVSTLREYGHNVFINCKYSFYSRKKTMYEYSHGNAAPVLNDTNHS